MYLSVLWLSSDGRDAHIFCCTLLLQCQLPNIIESVFFSFLFCDIFQAIVSNNLSLADVSCAVTILMSILYEAAIPRYLLCFYFCLFSSVTSGTGFATFQLNIVVFVLARISQVCQ